MCLGIPGRVIEFVDDTRQLALVEVSTVKRKVHVGLLLQDGLEMGDWVLVHVGFALSKIDDEEARRTLAFLRELGDAYEQELEELSQSNIE